MKVGRGMRRDVEGTSRSWRDRLAFQRAFMSVAHACKELIFAVMEGRSTDAGLRIRCSWVMTIQVDSTNVRSNHQKRQPAAV